MIWGMSTHTFTLVHVILSLVGIFTGFIVLFGLLAGRRLDVWTAIFLASTVATSVTGFGFPFEHFFPGLLPGQFAGFAGPEFFRIANRLAIHAAVIIETSDPGVFCELPRRLEDAGFFEVRLDVFFHQQRTLTSALRRLNGKLVHFAFSDTSSRAPLGMTPRAANGFAFVICAPAPILPA